MLETAPVTRVLSLGYHGVATRLVALFVGCRFADEEAEAQEGKWLAQSQGCGVYIRIPSWAACLHRRALRLLDFLPSSPGDCQEVTVTLGGECGLRSQAHVSLSGRLSLSEPQISHW